MFTTSMKVKIGLVMLLIPITVNLCWYYTQDALITLLFNLLFNLILIPIILGVILNKDLYDILTYKGLLDSNSKSKLSKILFAVAFLSIFLMFILFFYLGLFPNLKKVILLSAYFKYKWINYLYFAAILVIVFFTAKIEMKLYYGVLGTIIPDNFIGYAMIVIFQTSMWICFSIIFLNQDKLDISIFLILTFCYYLILYIVKEKDNYKVSAYIHISCYLLFVFLIFVYAHLSEYKKLGGKGIGMDLNNKNNIINKLI